MFKELISRVKTIFTKEEHIDFTADNEIAIGDEIKEEKISTQFNQFETVEEKKRKKLHYICITTKKFRIRKKLTKRIVNSFEKEGFFLE